MIKFICDRCQTEEKYNPSKVKEVDGRSLCIPCFNQFAHIERAVEVFSAAKRKELVGKFFAGMSAPEEVPEDPAEEPQETVEDVSQETE